MIASAVLGSVIISMATVSLFIAVKVGENTVRNAGNYSLTKSEKAYLLNISTFNYDDLDNLELDVQQLSAPNKWIKILLKIT